MELNEAQVRAIEWVRGYALGRREAAERTIDEILRMSNVSREEYEAAVAAVRRFGRVGLHFHPDRIGSNGRPVAESLLDEGIYRNQFETFLSNGKLSPHPGGPRDLWESALFGGAYRGEVVHSSERPKYGALNLMLHPDGPCPRFGSCYFLLRPRVLERCTFSYSDSHRDPREKGTIDVFDDVLAALLSDSFERDFALGVAQMRPAQLVAHLAKRLARPLDNPAGKQPARNLDHYIEAQVHGLIKLSDDIEALVADPSFKGTSVGQTLEELASKHGIVMQWHSGFTLRVEEIPSDFRGSAMPSLAARIAVFETIDAKTIGNAARDVTRNPEAWEDRGTVAEVLQELKLLWHVLVKFGRPLE